MENHGKDIVLSRNVQTMVESLKILSNPQFSSIFHIIINVHIWPLNPNFSHQILLLSPQISRRLWLHSISKLQASYDHHVHHAVTWHRKFHGSWELISLDKLGCFPDITWICGRLGINMYMIVYVRNYTQYLLTYWVYLCDDIWTYPFVIYMFLIPYSLIPSCVYNIYIYSDCMLMFS